MRLIGGRGEKSQLIEYVNKKILMHVVLLFCQQEKATHLHRIRELEAEAALQAARADTTAAALQALEDQRSAEAAAIAEQHKEELTAAHSESFVVIKNYTFGPTNVLNLRMTMTEKNRSVINEII